MTLTQLHIYMKLDIHILLFQNIFYLIIKENRNYAVIILSLQYRDNYGLGDRSCHNHTKLSYFIYNPRGVAEGDYIIIITKLSVIIGN